MEWVSGNIFIRPMGDEQGLQPGDVIAGHTHGFDHTTIFFCGRWRVRRWQPIVDEDGVHRTLSDGRDAFLLTDDFERDGPFHLLIAANSRHEFTFLGPADVVGRAWCVYSHRTPQGEVAVDFTGWHGAYR
jgi:hypothetical protein